eukprot:8411068-Prorocentrum_lima.AAC.1
MAPSAPFGNVLHGKFSSEVVASFERAEGVTLPLEQLECCNQFHRSSNCLFRVDALAGSGKTMIIWMIIHAVLPHLQENEAIV